ncbi:fimbrial protein [Aeromonas sp. BIGb0445]|jgi:major type 1 subunit fimbrin (pilin)|uniref:fimbrial protein n=1 Tax=Aeromonas sp. BIGb0445 TaxID=2940593 RepID=UPI002167ED29|nr:fimbrial protein [Aeromonas sp. BIGb0445]MCS3457996.1 major type 1 subunit fimbrin (pilin) [Aeromonas sp. BIGb0445]
MKINLLVALGLSASLLASGSVLAFNGTITITGEVTAGTCDISVNGGSASAIVTLPTVSTNALSGLGVTAGATGFNLELTSCPTTGSVRAYFENFGVAQSTGNLSNKAVASGGKNPAANVEVQILASDSTPIDLRDNTGNDVLVDFNATGDATLYYSAQYIATGAVGAGLVSADLIYSLDYH